MRGNTSKTLNYQVANTGGASSTDLRGAVQTSFIGGGVSDSRLSGSGVSAANFGPIAGGSSTSNLAVTFNAGNGGGLSSQSVKIANNFDNVTDQVINIVSTGVISILAQGNATPNSNPVNLGNFRVGGTQPSQSFSVQNTINGAGAERLGIASVVASGNFAGTNNLGAGFVGGGSSSAGAVSASVNGGVAGVNSGSVTIQYTTNGTLIDPTFTTINANQQSINLTATGYNVATGNAIPAGALNLGNFHVGQAGGAAPQSVNLNIANQASASFSEQLAVGSASSNNAAFTVTNNIGSGLVNGGATTNNALSVGRAGGVAGVNTGTVTIQYQSDGTNTSGLSAINSNSQAITLNATGYRLASSNTIAAVSFGNVHVGDTVSQTLTITNTAVNDSFSEKLNASFGGTSDARITTAGGISLLGAGQTNSSNLVIGLNTASAGTINGTATVLLASDGAGTSGLGVTALPSQNVGVTGDITISGSAYRLASASPVTPNPVNFGNVRVGTVTDQALSITNTAINDGFSEKLNASIGGATTGVTSNNGSFTLLGPQATNSTSLHIGLDSLTAGAKNGTATIALVSDGTGTSELGQTTLASQTVTITGNVYQVAQANVPTTINLGNVHTGATLSQAITIGNTLNAPAGFQEGLDVAVGTLRGTTASGGISNLAAGNTSNVVSVGLANIGAGAQSGTVQLNLASNGAGTSGLSTMSLGSSTVTVQAAGYNLAQASVTPNPVTVANQRVGGSNSSALTVANTAPNSAFTETLSAGFGSNSGAASNNGGSVSSIGGGSSNNSALQVRVDTTSAGHKTGNVSVNLTSNEVGGSGLGNTVLVAQNVTISGDVYRLASPTINTPAVTLAARVGDANPTASISITNTSPDIYTEGLNVSRGATAAGFTSGGAISNLVAGGSSSAIGVALNTATAGTFSGNQVLSLASNGSLTGNSDFDLGSANVALNGKVYTVAAGQVAPTNINFGIVHVGDVATAQNVAVTNTAAVTALNDTLKGNFSGAGGPFTVSGNLGNGVQAGAADSTSLNASLNTSAVGVYSSQGFVNLSSHNNDMADLALSITAVDLQGTVNNYADASLRKTSGAGTLSRSGDTFTLDFGSLLLGSGAVSSELGALNDVFGPSDLLDGEFQFIDTNDFSFSGFNAFLDLATWQGGAGPSINGLFAQFSTAALGSFQDTILFRSKGHNSSGYEDANFTDLTLIIRGTVIEGVGNNVPEPGSLALGMTGLLALAALRRRRAAATLAHH